MARPRVRWASSLPHPVGVIRLERGVGVKEHVLARLMLSARGFCPTFAYTAFGGAYDQRAVFNGDIDSVLQLSLLEQRFGDANAFGIADSYDSRSHRALQARGLTM